MTSDIGVKVDSSIIQTLFDFITNNIFIIIFIFAIVEVYLILDMVRMMKKHESVLLDVSDNLLKGFRDAPDKDSDQMINERIQASLDYIHRKINENPESKSDFAKNANKIIQRPLYKRHYKIEIYSSVMSTLVQIFPLLGILGTILAIAQTSVGGQIDAAKLSQAFVLAMDTTILGIAFSILFMVIESALQPKVDRVINESNDFKQIVNNVNMVH